MLKTLSIQMCLPTVYVLKKQGGSFFFFFFSPGGREESEDPVKKVGFVFVLRISGEMALQRSRSEI